LIQGPVAQVAFSRDGQSLASAHNEGTAILWKLADDPIADAPEILGQLKGFNSNLNTVAYDRNGKVLVTGDEVGELIFWDLTTFKPARPAIDSGSGAIYRVNFSPDGNLLVSAHKSGAVNLWPINTGEEETTSWETYVCGIVNRNLTPDEFIPFFPGEPYRKICPDLP
jgi:WD40 repeat protein